VDKTKKGPSLKKIAAKYKGKADGQANAIKNMTTGPKVKSEDGTEESHKIIDSKDPVALDMLSIKELDRQRLATQAPVVKPNLDLYDTAALLQLGVSDLKRIQVDKLR